MKRFDVLTIGLQVIDLMIPGMDGHILDREMTLLDHAELTLGGDALNQAIVLSQLGARTALMGAAGVDRPRPSGLSVHRATRLLSISYAVFCLKKKTKKKRKKEAKQQQNSARRRKREESTR